MQIHKKVWFIFGEITKDDFEWILRSNLEFTNAKQHYLDFTEIGTKVPVKIAGKLDPAKIVTTCDKEETWIKLYFADRLVLTQSDNNHNYNYIEY